VQSIAKWLFPLLNLPCHANRVTPDNLRAFGETDPTGLVDAGFLVPMGPATHVQAINGCGCGVHEVVRIGRGTRARFMTSCVIDGVEEIQRDRLRQWFVNDLQVGDELATAIKSDSKCRAIVIDGAWLIGELIVAGARLEIVLARESDVDRIAECIVPSRAIVVVADSVQRNWDQFAGVVKLSDAFSFAGPKPVFQADRVRSMVRWEDGTDGNVFLCKGEFWELRHVGKVAHLKDSVGMGYLARLLAQPNRVIPAVTLLASRLGIDPLQLSGSSGEVIDEQAREDYRGRYLMLLDDMRLAEANHDRATMERIQLEQDALTTELSAAFGKDGRGRVKSDAEKVRKSVSMAVTRAIEKITVHHTSLGRYLDASMELGGTMVYRQHEPMDWLV